MQRPIARLASLPLVLLLAATVVAQDKTKAKPGQKHMVRFSFKKGTTRHSVFDMDMTMTMNMGAEDIKTLVKTTMWTSTTVKATNGNIADIEQLVTRVKSKSDSLLMKVDYDSDDEDSDPGAMEALSELVGQTTKMKLSDRGKMSDIKMPAAADQLEQAGVNLNEVLKAMVTQLPDHPIAIGETWKVDQKVPMGAFGDADGAMHFKLIAIDRTTLTLEQELIVDTSKLQMPGVKGFTMKSRGTSRLDLMTGSPIEMDMTSTTTVDSAMKMVIKMRQTVKPTKAPVKKPANKPAEKAQPTKVGK